MEAGQERWFSLNSQPVPVFRDSGVSLAEPVGYTSIGVGSALAYRLQQNHRDIWPRRGSILSVSGHTDIWMSWVRNGGLWLGRVAVYLSPSRRAHTGLRLGTSVLVQNRGGVFDPILIMPRTYEDAYIDAGGVVKADLEVVQPFGI